MKKISILTSSILLLLGFLNALVGNPVKYSASGDKKGKHIVLIASDHEYRAEETIPALARILAVHHGFDCTVLFGLDESGEIEAGASNIPGLEALKKADGAIFFIRFLALPSILRYVLESTSLPSSSMFGGLLRFKLPIYII